MSDHGGPQVVLVNNRAETHAMRAEDFYAELHEIERLTRAATTRYALIDFTESPIAVHALDDFQGVRPDVREVFERLAEDVARHVALPHP